MKFLIVLAFAFIYGINMVYTQNGARVCVIRPNCNRSNATICARFGQSNLCQKFNNLCTFQAIGCNSATPYTRVNDSQCTSISVNTRRRCGGSSSSSSGLFGSSSSSSSNSGANVTPIIIRV